MMRPLLNRQIRAPNPMPRLKRLVARTLRHRVFLLQPLVAVRRRGAALGRERVLERFAHAVEG